jgi:ankyrin repeat protein
MSGREKEAVIEALCRAGAKVDARDDDGYTALAMAKDAAVARCLVKHGADVNVQSPRGSTLLEKEVIAGRRDMCEALLDGGANVDAKHHIHGEALLSVAARRGYTPIVELFIDRGADPNIMSDIGIAPLHVAAEDGNADMVRVLLAKGADVNLLGEFGTPLHAAAQQGKVEVLRILLAHGADPLLTDFYGRTALDVAVEAKQEETARILRSAMERIRTRPPAK